MGVSTIDKTAVTRKIIWLILCVVLGVGSGFVSQAIRNPIFIFAGLAGLAMVGLTVSKTQIGLLAMVALIYMRLSDIGVEMFDFPSILQPFLGLLVMTIFLRWVLFRETPIGWGRAVLLVIAYGMVVAASLLYAQDYPAAYRAFTDYIKDATIAFLVVILTKKSSDLKNIIWTLLGIGLFLSVINIYQFYTGDFTNQYYGFAKANMQTIVGETDDYRIGGPIGDPNYFALILLVLIPFGFERLINEKNFFLRVFAGLALVACLLTIILTYSRGAFVALVILSTVMILRTPGKPIPFLLISVILVALAVKFAPAQYMDRMETMLAYLPGSNARETDSSIDSRSSEYTISLAIFMDYPLFGVGKDNYIARNVEYAIKTGADPNRQPEAPHNLYIEVMAESGLIGFLIFMFVVYQMLDVPMTAYRRLKNHGLEEKAQLLRGVTYAVVAYLAGSMFLHAAYGRYFWFLFGLAMAAENLANNEIKHQMEEPRSQDSV